MDGARHKAFVHTSDTFGGIDTLQCSKRAAHHAILLLADDEDACDFERMRKKNGTESETSIEGHPLVA